MYSHHSNKGTNAAGTPQFSLNEVLIEINGWRLVKPLYPELLKCESYVVHMKCPALSAPLRTSQHQRTTQQVGEQVSKKCRLCNETPPAEIIALELLHNGGI